MLIRRSAVPGFLRVGKSSSWTRSHGKFVKDLEIQDGGVPKIKVNVNDLRAAESRSKLNLFSLNLKKFGTTELFYSAFFS